MARSKRTNFALPQTARLAKRNALVSRFVVSVLATVLLILVGRGQSEVGNLVVSCVPVDVIDRVNLGAISMMPEPNHPMNRVMPPVDFHAQTATARVLRSNPNTDPPAVSGTRSVL
jgi:hypothetical protein